MKGTGIQTKLFTIATAVGMIAATLIVAGMRPVAAVEKNSEAFLAYGIANITRGQTARLHVVTVGNPNELPAELVIYDSQGNVLKHSLERLVPGKAALLDFSFDQQPGIAGTRLEFYAVVRFNLGRDGGYVIPSLEVLEDDSGRSILMIADPMG